jgi:hypothetical protein
MLLLLLAGMGGRDPRRETVLMPAKAGPTFTRRRFRKILEEEEARLEAERQKLAEQERQRIADAVAARRAQIQEQVHRLLEQANAAAGVPLPLGQPASVTMPDYSALHGMTQDEQDEDEAIALLLLSQ